MALLTLVRHGQASFLADNYDKLSPLGERQAHILGEYWIAHGVHFDQIYFGPAERQIRTGQIACAVFAQAGLPCPEPVILPDFDEYAGIEVIRTFLPELIEKHQDIREMEAAFRSAADKNEAARTYDRLFQRITRMWAAEELDSADVEPWAHFCARVARGVSEVRERSSRNGRIALFTSGGVIAATARIALDLDPLKTLDLSWTSRNASFSEFLFSGDRFSLAGFNHLPHLTDGGLITYR